MYIIKAYHRASNKYEKLAQETDLREAIGQAQCLACAFRNGELNLEKFREADWFTVSVRTPENKKKFKDIAIVTVGGAVYFK